MPLPLAACGGPTGLRVAIDCQGCRGLRPKGVLTEALRGRLPADGLAARAEAQFAQEEISLRTFIIGQARPVLGQSRIGQNFQPDGGDGFGRRGEGELVGVTLADVAAGKDRGVFLNGQEREVGGRGRGTQGSPTNGRLAGFA